MATVAPIQTSFNTGELTPLAYGRVDYPKYKSAVALMQNFIPQVQGGATRRTGTYDVASIKGSAAKVVRFVFSNGDAFLLEFSDFALRFVRNRAQLNMAAAPAYAPATAYAKNAFVTYLGVQYMSLQAANTGNTPSTSPLWWVAQDAFEVSTPYAIADVPFLRFQQSKDVLYIAHPSYAPRKLVRNSLYDWSFSTVDFLDGPYLRLKSNNTTIMTPSATGTGSVTLTASSVTDINGGQGFLATDVGRLVRLKHSTTWGWGVITAFTSSTVVTVNVRSAFGAAAGTLSWRLGEWSETTGYPSTNFLFEDRLGWAASVAAPTTMNLSKTGDYENMAPTGTDSVVAADNALQLTTNSKGEDPIRWVVDDEQGLVVGTKGGEFLARASSTGESMSAINYPSLRRSTKYGSANVEIVEAGKAILFVQTAKRKLRELAFVYNVDGFRAPDMTVLAEHASKGKISQMAYQQEPFSIVWVMMENGELWGMTYDREQEIVGWHRHYIGGFFDAAKTQRAKVESIAVIPAPDGSQDDLWLVVARYVNGAVVRRIEYLAPFNSNYDDVKDCYFVDGGKTINLGAPATVVTGLGHLEGQSVSVLVDGSPQPDRVVTAGQITLDRAGTLVHVGLGYVSRLKTLRQEAGSENGTAQGKTKRINKLTIRFHETVGGRVGRDFREKGVPMDEIQFRSGSAPMGTATPLFSGDKEANFEDDYTLDAYICYEQTQPLPSTILATMPQLTTQD